MLGPASEIAKWSGLETVASTAGLGAGVASAAEKFELIGRAEVLTWPEEPVDCACNSGAKENSMMAKFKVFINGSLYKFEKGAPDV